MGCWNGTCGLSQMSINHGDEVVGFILVPEEKMTPDCGGYCYADEMWQPIPVPFYGKYDDYGSIEEVKQTKAAKIVLEYFKKKHGIKSLDELMKYAERDSKTNSFSGYGLMMVHRELFDYFCNGEDLEKYFKIHMEKVDKIKNVKKSDLDFFNKPRLLSHKYWSTLYEVDNLTDSTDKEVIKDVLRVQLMDYTLIIARKNWMPQAGAGSQNDNWKMIEKLGAFASKKISDRQEYLRKEYGEEDFTYED